MRARFLMMLSLVVLAACCSDSSGGGETTTKAGPRALSIKVGSGSGGSSLLEFNGVHVEVERSVTLSLPAGFTLNITEGDGRAIIDQHTGPEVLVNGKVLDVVDGELFLGDESFGLMTSDDVVVIGGEGVKVNGDARVGRPAADPASGSSAPR